MEDALKEAFKFSQMDLLSHSCISAGKTYDIQASKIRECRKCFSSQSISGAGRSRPTTNSFMKTFRCRIVMKNVVGAPSIVRPPIFMDQKGPNSKGVHVYDTQSYTETYALGEMVLHSVQLIHLTDAVSWAESTRTGVGNSLN